MLARLFVRANSFGSAIAFLFLLATRRVRAEISIQLSSTQCANNTLSKVNNGCYMFGNTTTQKANWTDAESLCSKMSTDLGTGVVGHLMALESEAEAIAVHYWLKGNSLNYNYWMNAELQIKEAANTYSMITYQPYWTWTYDSVYAEQYDYLQHANMQFQLGYAMYLYYNGTGHEYRSNTTDQSFSYICEFNYPCPTASDPCSNGTCYINSGRPYCDCYPGYYGSTCDNQYDLCDSVPCQHGGTCTTLVNNYTCTCTQYYSGSNCENSVGYNMAVARTVFTWLCVGIVGLIILLLCLMDLPWNAIMKQFTAKYKEHQEQKEAEKIAAMHADENPVTQTTKTRAQLMNTEEEILQKLQTTLKPGTAYQSDMRYRNNTMLY